MAQYTVEAIDHKGQRLTVEIAALSESDLEIECGRSNLQIIDYKIAKGRLGFSRKPSKGELSPKEVCFFLERLHPMVAMNIPNNKCMDFLSSRGNLTSRQLATDIKANLVDKTLAEAITATNRFPPLVEGALKAGNQASDLPGTIEMLSRFYRMRTEMAASIRGALFQPILSIVLALGVLIFNIMFIVPKMAEMMASMGSKPEGFMALLGTVAGLLRGYWYLTLAFLGGIIFFFVRKSSPRDVLFEGIIKRVSMFRDVVYGMRQTALCYGLHILYKANMPPKQIFDYLVQIQKGNPMEQELREAESYFANVPKMSQAFEKCCPSLEPDLIYKLETGELTTSVPEQMLSSAGILEKSTAMACKNLAVRLNPFVGFFTFVIILAAYATTAVPTFIMMNNMMANSNTHGGR